MAKRKHRPNRTRPVVRPISSNCDDRLKRLAWELGIAGAMVLQNHFSFTKDQSAEWAKLTIEQAEKNRKEDIESVLSKQRQAENDPGNP